MNNQSDITDPRLQETNTLSNACLLPDCSTACEHEEVLLSMVGKAGLIVKPTEMTPYLSDWSAVEQGNAKYVVRPATTAELVAVVKYCAQYRIPIVTQGGRTGMAGGATPSKQGNEIVVNMERMNRIVEIDVDNSTVTVEAGCILHTLKEAVAKVGRLFPLSLGAEGSSQIGGNLSTNAGGLNVLRYSSVRASVLGLEVVLPDGSVFDGLRRLRKDNTGYDLKQLFVGAEGTLGIITQAVLRLHHPDRQTATAWLSVPNPLAAVRLLSFLRLHVGERVTCFELISQEALDLVVRHMGIRAPLKSSGGWHILTEWGESLVATDLHAVMEDVLGQAMEAGLVDDAALASSLSQAATFWALREGITEAQRAEGMVVKHDVSVPLSAIPCFLAKAGGAVKKAIPNALIVAFGHVGDGNIHYNLVQRAEIDASEFRADTLGISHLVYDIVSEFGGSISAEHGLGQLKVNEALLRKGEVEMTLMKVLKKAIDPMNLMNPGKVVCVE